MFPHFPVYTTLPTASFLTPLDRLQYLNHMAYFNNYTSFYPTPSAREEFSAHQFLDQTSAAEGVNYEGSQVTFPDCWNTFQQPEPTVGSSAALPATVGHGEHYYNLFVDWRLTLGSPESLAPATSYMNQTGSYDQLSYSSHYWPEVGQQAQTYHPGFSSQNFSPAIMAAPEPSAVVPTPNSGESLLSLKLRTLEYLPITNSPARLLGGKPERTLYQRVLYGRR